MTLRSLAENWTLKLFSLGAGVLLFLFVTLENATPMDVDFRIEYRLADDIMLTNDAPTVLHTTLQGPWAAFRSFDASELEPVLIDLSHAEPGNLRHIVGINAINPPGGMRVVAIRPAAIDITLDRRIERMVPIHPDIPEAPAMGYQVLDVRMVPPRARVVGPAAKIQSIDFITTRTIDIIGREEDLRLEVDLRPPPPPLRLLDKRVLVFVEIGEEFVQRTFQNIPVQLENAPKGAHVYPTDVPISVKGPRRVVEKMTKDNLIAVVDIGKEVAEELTDIKKVVQVRPDLPERTQLVAPVPRVEIQISTPKHTAKKKGKS